MADPRRIDITEFADAAPAPHARHRYRPDQRLDAHHPGKRLGGQGLHRGTLRGLRRVQSHGHAIIRPKKSARSPAFRWSNSTRPPRSWATTNRRPSSGRWASPSTSPACATSWTWPTCKCCSATWASPAAASTRCADRTTSRAPATWAACRMFTRLTSRSPTKKSTRKFQAAWGAASLPESRSDRHRDDARHASRARRHALYILGEDPIMSDPDTHHIRHCLEAVDFIVLQEIFPSETSAYADVLLPGVTFAEKTGTFTNTERRVQMVRKAIPTHGRCA
ncbi:MAG: molybdopterin-dependent oxidoreductase [Desulfobacterales bacterium]|nr:molybdopterin-dependent oxidoreductase [Desulfobacterales bacterium]